MSSKNGSKLPAPPPALGDVPLDLLGRPPGQDFTDRLAVRDVLGDARPAAVALAEAELEADMDATRDALDASLDYRDAQIAASVNMPVATFQALPDGVKAMIFRSLAPTDDMSNLFQNPTIDDKFAIGANGAVTSEPGVMSQQQYEKLLAADIADFNPKTHILMVRRARPYQDPDGVTRMYHPGIAPVPLAEAARKLREGWLTRRKYNYLPIGSFPCEMASNNGEQCPFRGRSPDDVQMHQVHYHPAEYEAMEKAAGRLATQQSTKTLEELVKTLVARDGGPVDIEAIVEAAVAKRLAERDAA